MKIIFMRTLGGWHIPKLLKKFTSSKCHQNGNFNVPLKVLARFLEGFQKV